MALKEQISNDMKTALLGGNRFEGDTLRDLKAAILNEEVAKNKRDSGLDDSEIEVIIAREVKKRRESILMYEANGRPELAESEKAEISVIEKYLPQQIDEAELQAIVEMKVTELGANGPQAMGQVIGAVKAQVGNAADGAMIARLTKNALNK
ncbi:GatB/YqeY [Candidatus Saccharibacteria bacterium]|nr:GatB/YqeY [Candidatus Saccharibacteria bacterium]